MPSRSRLFSGIPEPGAGLQCPPKVGLGNALAGLVTITPSMCDEWLQICLFINKIAREDRGSRAEDSDKYGHGLSDES